MIGILAFSALGAACSKSPSGKTPSAPETEAKVIVLSGQSNMVGNTFARNLIGDEEKYRRATFKNIKILLSVNPLAGDGSSNITDDFVPVTCGMGRNSEYAVSVGGCFGPELGLAAYLAKTYPDETFYFIKDATGGTTLNKDWWSPSSRTLLNETSDGILYTHLLERVDLGMELLKEDGLNPKIYSFMWLQGGSDALSSQYIGRYNKLWNNFIGDVQNAWADKEYLTEGGMSVVHCGLHAITPYQSTISFCKKMYADEHSKTFYIDPDISWCTYFRDNTDYYHLDASAMLRMGRELGLKFTEGLKDKSPDVYTPYVVPFEGEGTQSSPYRIKTAEDLKLLACLVNCGIAADKCYRLENDIDITAMGRTKEVYTEQVYNAIGVLHSAFKGVFDGNYKTITVDAEASCMYGGIFGYNEGIIKNFTVKGKAIYSRYYCGGVCGYNLGTIENVTSEVELTIPPVENAVSGYIGGVCGYAAGSAKIENCTFLGSIAFGKGASTQRIGGIVGYTTGNVSIKNCVNGAKDSQKGAIKAGSRVGGIVGMAEGATSVTECENYGAVTATISDAGGITGYKEETVTVANCTDHRA